MRALHSVGEVIDIAMIALRSPVADGRHDRLLAAGEGFYTSPSRAATLIAIGAAALDGDDAEAARAVAEYVDDPEIAAWIEARTARLIAGAWSEGMTPDA